MNVGTLTRTETRTGIISADMDPRRTLADLCRGLCAQPGSSLMGGPRKICPLSYAADAGDTRLNPECTNASETYQRLSDGFA